MPIYLGRTKQSILYYGGVRIKEAYYGSIKVYGAGSSQSVRFDYTGSVQTWTVPAGVYSLHIDCVGAGGQQNGYGGKGGRVQCKLSVTPNQTLSIYVGGNNGWNGGSSDGYNTSGDASDIRIGGTTLNDRKVVAGGGGAGFAMAAIAITGGAGGGLVGGNGSHYGGKGGTQTAGGKGYAGGGLYGSDGSFGQGRGGGGGGWYGGGGAGIDQYGPEGGGGGGSSYTDPNLCTDVVHTQGYSEATGNGWIIIGVG